MTIKLSQANDHYLRRQLEQTLNAMEAVDTDHETRITILEGMGGGGGNSVTVTCNFGGNFTDKVQTVVTGQVWVTAFSEIIPQVLTPPGTDPDEMRLLDFKPVISDLVAGVGFTLTLYSEPEARGSYSVMCIGV